MISKNLIDYLATKSEIKQKDLIEKDIILHKLLFKLSEDKSFFKKYVFKGGTCLIKCYFGYYRFSEDLDFSWIKQDIFKNKSGKQIRKELSAEINLFLMLLEETARAIGLDFKADKQDKKYVELGGSNRFLTCKLWYKSAGIEQFVKVQVNYVEKFEYKFRKLTAKTLLKDIDTKEFLFLFPEEKSIICIPVVTAYDIKEILLEKARAIVTRQGVKARDFVDTYLICKYEKLSFENFEAKIIAKIRAMLKYEKYMKNLKNKKKNRFAFKLGDEKRLLLEPLDDGFREFLPKFNTFLGKIIDKIL